jgi:hypothetical protein
MSVVPVATQIRVTVPKTNIALLLAERGCTPMDTFRQWSLSTKSPMAHLLSQEMGHWALEVDQENYLRLIVAFSGRSCEEPPTRMV